jgi:predicted permease
MDNLWRDLKYAVRAIYSKPGFSLMVIGMLAAGVAGNAAIFSIFDGLFLRPMPFAESGRLVDVDTTAPKWNLNFVSTSPFDAYNWREGNQTFEDLAFFSTGGCNLVLRPGDAQRVNVALVTANLLDVLGLKPALGRGFTLEEDKPKGNKVAMIGYLFWKRQFGGDRGVPGRVIKADGDAYTIVGVLPREAVFPSGVDIWAPLAADRAQEGAYYLKGIGRLKPGVTIQQAKTDLLRVHKAANADGKHGLNDATAPTLMPLRDRYLGDYRDATQILLGGVGVVLLIVCVNIAGLMLVRGTGRAREIAIRTAIGASRGAIVRQLLTECLTLAAVGGVLGVVAGHVCLQGMLALLPTDMPQWLDFSMDWRFLLFCAALTMGSAVLFGLAPALQALRVEPRAWLQDGARASLSRGRRLVLNTLIVGEVGLALVLLISAGLLLQAFRRVTSVDPGFRADHVMTFTVWLPDAQYSKPEQARHFYGTLIERLRALPGVQSVSAVNQVPFSDHTGTFYQAVEGRKLGPNESNPVVLDLTAFPDYFQSMGITFLSGRPFTEHENESKDHPVVVINESFAKYFFPGMDPIGKHLRCCGDDKAPALEIIGVTRDTRHYGLDQEMRPSVVQPFSQHSANAMFIEMRTAMEPHAIVGAAREVLRSLDPELPMYEPRTMGERMDRSLWTRRAYSWLFGIFALLAVILAAAGVYGVTSYVVSQRTREIGIRMALGALPAQILGQVLRAGMVLVGIGVALGIAGALLSDRFLKSLLFNGGGRDPFTYVAVVAGVAAVGLLANVVPARRAASLNPMQTLRSE